MCRMWLNVWRPVISWFTAQWVISRRGLLSALSHPQLSSPPKIKSDFREVNMTHPDRVQTARRVSVGSALAPRDGMLSSQRASDHSADLLTPTAETTSVWLWRCSDCRVETLISSHRAETNPEAVCQRTSSGASGEVGRRLLSVQQWRPDTGHN